jgi:hypothetical protein
MTSNRNTYAFEAGIERDVSLPQRGEEGRRGSSKARGVKLGRMPAGIKLALAA